MPEGAVKLCADGRVTLNPNGTRALCCANQGEPTDPGTPIDVACCPTPSQGARSWRNIYLPSGAKTPSFPVDFLPSGLPNLPDLCVGTGTFQTRVNEAVFEKITDARYVWRGNNFYDRSVPVTSFIYQRESGSFPVRTFNNGGLGVPGIPTNDSYITSVRLQQSSANRQRIDLNSQDPSVDTTTPLAATMNFLSVPFSTGTTRTHRNRVLGAFRDGGTGPIDNAMYYRAQVSTRLETPPRIYASLDGVVSRLNPTAQPSQRDSGTVTTSYSVGKQVGQIVDTLNRSFSATGSQFVYQITHSIVLSSSSPNTGSSTDDDLASQTVTESMSLTVRGTYTWVGQCPGGNEPPPSGLTFDDLLNRIRGLPA